LFQNGPLSDDDEAFRRLNQTNLIQFPGDSGMAFSTGRLQASQIRNCLAEGATKTLYKMMFCKIAVGRSLAMPSEDEAQRAPLPNGYDSFLIHDQENSRKQDQSSQLYLIKNGSQLLPLYFVQFEFDPELERRSREQPRCDNCETAAAEVHCPADSANLCGACDTKLHSTSKIAQRHRRNPIKRVSIHDNNFDCRVKLSGHRCTGMLSSSRIAEN
jgi:hypothetical protein